MKTLSTSGFVTDILMGCLFGIALSVLLHTHNKEIKVKKILLVLCFIFTACASTPPVPEGMILVQEKKLDVLIQEYTQQRADLQKLKELEEWRDNMFF